MDVPIEKADDPAREIFDLEERKSLLRFITCGSVDDGKSTLIGRLLYDTKQVYEDHLAEIEPASTFKSERGIPDFANLVDGLEAEREQGITIDIAYRFFATRRRKFVIADTPGHEQYTRNMATAASNSDLAVILLDARKGVLDQTRRHSFIASLFGIRHAVLAVNKMDLVEFSQDVFENILAQYLVLARKLHFVSFQAIPISARCGHNVVECSSVFPWYTGPCLLDYLDTVEVLQPGSETPFRMPVQLVNRPNQDFRGFAGTVASGEIRKGDPICVASAEYSSRVQSIITYDGEQEAALAGQAITITLEDEVDISRGDVIACTSSPPTIADQFSAAVIWLDDSPLLPGRSYLLKLGTRQVRATFTAIKCKVDPHSLQELASTTLSLNEIGMVNVALQEPVAFDPYEEVRATGGFIVIDRMSFATVGAGMVRFGLQRAGNIRWQSVSIDKRARAAAKAQRPVLLWFTGLSGAGKTTIANLVETKLHARGCHTYLLDGDNVRHGLCRDLGFTLAARVENNRRVAEAARLMVDAGLIVLAALISPFRAERQYARELMGAGEFVEIFVDTPLQVAEKRDPKGLYRRARRGEIKNFTGIDSPYEAPDPPDVHLETDTTDPDELANRVVQFLEERGYLDYYHEAVVPLQP
ncbi:sulfate adenylyltransferase subunit CysN [Shinella sumterensis]|uniref:sulfate adenylyltransferase subunit CysN n=1 Tax=Shinella sumterensis TaxID=1967501 RepID=UPI003F828700